MKVLVGIAAYNEEENIGGLLSFLANEHCVDEIVVVSSSTDKTNSIVEGFAQSKGSTVKLIVESERRGKSSACNILMEYAESRSFDVIVYLGGDNLPLKGSIEALLSGFDSERVGVVGGRPTPVDEPKTFMGWTTHLQWQMHHTISSSHQPKISGEFMAFRPGVVREIPIAIINDDAYIQLVGGAKGYESRYSPSAVVKLKGCSSSREYLRQRRRVYLGHLQVLFLTGLKLTTFKWRSYPQVLKKSLPSFGVYQLCYLLGAIILQIWAYMLALGDFHLFRLPYKWEIARTTKASLADSSVSIEEESRIREPGSAEVAVRALHTQN